MSQLPRGLQFKSVKPQGFYQEFRDYVVTPIQTYTNVFSVFDVVRIQFNLQDWYIDPYESFIEAEVRLADETPLNMSTSVDITTNNPIKFLMMDGPSTSLINDYRLECNSKEVERIREYDQIGNILTDLNMYPEAVDQKDYEGYYTVRGHKTLSESNTINKLAPHGNSSGATDTLHQSHSNCNVLGLAGATLYGQEPVYNTQLSMPALASETTVSVDSLAWYTQETYAPAGYTATRADYETPYKVLSAAGNAVLKNTATPSLLHRYDQYIGSLTAGNTNFGIQSSDYSYSLPSSSMNNGSIHCLNSPKLMQCDGHNTFLTNLPTSKITDGFFNNSIYTNSAQTQSSRAYLQIPLLSGVLGVLIPSDRWQLIPSSSLGQVNMEFRFNPDAFFSHDGTMPNWLVSKFQLKLRMYRFDSALMSQLRTSIAGGIQMHSQSFSMGPTYNIQPNVSVTNNWQLNNGIPSIKQLFFWFLSDDYGMYKYCRKNYRLSQNITSMQLKVSSNYIPVNPIVGHAGNIVMNQLKQQDNSVFVSELHQAMNCLFDTQKHININKLNFALNERPYDVTLAKMFNKSDFTDAKKALLKASGYTMFNEMRCKGKALYAFNLEADKRNDETMTGIDTTKVRPIELILRADDSQSFTRNSTMYVSFLCDFIVSFGAQDVTTEGQG